MLIELTVKLLNGSSKTLYRVSLRDSGGGESRPKGCVLQTLEFCEQLNEAELIDGNNSFSCFGVRKKKLKRIYTDMKYVSERNHIEYL